MNQIIDNGFILHRLPYRETSLIVDFFLQHHGRLTVVAKGVRTERSRLKGILHPFSPIHVIAKGKSELKTLVLAESLSPSIFLKPMPMICACYINELMMRLLPKFESNIKLYFIYQATLIALENVSANEAHLDCEKALRLFEKNLLEALGYAIPLTHESQFSRAIIYDQYYQFIPEYGFILSQRKEGIDIFLGETLHAIDQDQFSNQAVLKSAKRLFRLAIHPLLGEKPLKTRALFKKFS